MKTTIWHNPRCSKSRQTLSLLEGAGIRPEIRKYLEDSPSANEIEMVLDMLTLEPRALMRVNEPVYKELGLADVEEKETLIQAMANNPGLIERPVVIHGRKACLGRPPERVLDIL